MTSQLPTAVLHWIGERMVALARRHPVAQASDWGFIMKMGTMVPCAVGRVRDYVVRLHALAEAIEEGQIHEPWLKAIEERDNVFPDLDYRIYVRRGPRS